MYDLLKNVEYGGCSAKLPADLLENLLNGVNLNKNEKLLVGTDTHDDAAVYKLNDEQAIIFTTDFFPPVCSDAYTFGQIAATNSLSDIYAMGGQVIMALNLIMVPSKDIPFSVLTEILKGGHDKVSEAGGMIVGGHTIDDVTTKYGLAVVGLIHPNKIITNACAKSGDVIILTKPIGTGTVLAGYKLNMTSEDNLEKALTQMKQLNKQASEIMVKHKVTCATDITGFGLLGHLAKLAKASQVKVFINADEVPVLSGGYELIEKGCIPGASFRNAEYMSKFSKIINIHNLTYEKRMMMCDAQTSGGMLICASETEADVLLKDLRDIYAETTVIGKII